MNVEEICKELDSLSIRMLQLMKEYINVKLIIEDLIKNGSLHLAKSRYIMGNRNVSALQLPSEESNDVIASTTVICKETTDEVLLLELSRLNIHRNGKGDDSDALRQRNKKKEEDKLEKECSRDPLKWFGVLVPHDMRQAQSKFNKAIEYVVECANLQIEMLSVEAKYKRLLSKKLEMNKQ
ncbi:coiled-coil domain-containing protein 115 [Rhodnius prolixus]|uniref:Vacuolar ATPase assembly protein VMA22 n=2 Tax=Rhodnius TaxID=13248 RepID=R4G422_RHOPR